jgi:hypothetical protein
VEVAAVTVGSAEDRDERVVSFELEKFHKYSFLVVYNQNSRVGEARLVLGNLVKCSGHRLG